MAEVIADGLLVCTDCAALIANGEGPEGHEVKIINMWSGDARGLVLACVEDCEAGCTEFSSRDCDGCGSKLAGYRHLAAVLR